MAVAASVVERADVVAGEVVGVHPGAGGDGRVAEPIGMPKRTIFSPASMARAATLWPSSTGSVIEQVAAVSAHDVARVAAARSRCRRCPPRPGGAAAPPAHRSTSGPVPASMSTIAFTRSPVSAASSGRSSLMAASDDRWPIHGERVERRSGDPVQHRRPVRRERVAGGAHVQLAPVEQRVVEGDRPGGVADEDEPAARADQLEGSLHGGLRARGVEHERRQVAVEVLAEGVAQVRPGGQGGQPRGALGERQPVR